MSSNKFDEISFNVFDKTLLDLYDDQFELNSFKLLIENKQKKPLILLELFSRLKKMMMLNLLSI